MDPEEPPVDNAVGAMMRVDLGAVSDAPVELLPVAVDDTPVPMDEVLPVGPPPSVAVIALPGQASGLRAALSAAIPVAADLLESMRRADECATALRASVEAASAARDTLDTAVSLFNMLSTPAAAASPGRDDEGTSSNGTPARTTASSSAAAIPEDGAPAGEAPRANPGAGAVLASPSVFLDRRSLLDLVTQLLDACPVNPTLFRVHVRSLCKKVGYACFTRRGLRTFAVDAFERFEGDPVSPRSLCVFRRMIPHLAGVFWDSHFRRNAQEPFNVCSEHCADEVKRSGHTHVLID